MPRSRNVADQINLNLQTQITSILDRLVGQIGGLILSRSTATTFSVSAGAARSENAGTSRQMQLTSAFTKSLSAWAIGTGNGALDTGTIAANSWYHVHIIRRDSDAAIDVLLSLSATAPTMPSGWVARRRIGSIRTDGTSQITPFTQEGDTFNWATSVTDVNATNPGTAAVTQALTVPTGVVVFPIVAWSLNNTTTTPAFVLISPLTMNDQVPSSTLYSFAGQHGVVNSFGSTVISDVPTNTSAQIRTRLSGSGASDFFRGVTHGWIDPRGK